MELNEGIARLLIGGAIGYVLGVITMLLRDIKRKVDAVAIPPKRDDQGFMQTRILKDVLYLLVLLITLAGLYQSNKARDQAEDNSHDDEIARCVSGEDSRNVQRGIVDAIYSLALGFSVQDKDAPPLTPEEQQQLDAYISGLDAFRVNTYDKIKPSDLCAPYVHDDDVIPAPIDPADLLPDQGERK